MACFALRVKRFTGRAKHWARDAQPIDLHDIRDPADHIAERAELSRRASALNPSIFISNDQPRAANGRGMSMACIRSS